MLRRAVISAAVVLLAGSAHGVGVSGRLTSSLYTYQSEGLDSISTTYARVHQAVNLDLTDLGSRNLAFHTYLRATTDLAEKAAGDPSLRAINAYLTWQQQGQRLTLGRQRVQAGAGRGTIDGVRADLSAAGTRLTLFAGPLAPADGSAELGKWSAGRLWGARLAPPRLAATDLAVSVARLEREPGAYADSGRFSHTLGATQMRQQTLAGLDAGRQFGSHHSAYLRLEYDAETATLRRAETRCRWAVSSRTSLEAEWLRREPGLLAGSVLSVFPSSAYQEMGLRAHLQANPALRLHGNVATVRLDGDDAWRLGLSADLEGGYSLGYYRTMGYSRLSDGLVGSLYRPLGRRCVLQGQADLTSYERDDADDSREEAAAASLGVSFRPTRALNLQADVQAVRNAMYAVDTRLFARATWSFFTRGNR